MTRSGVRVSVKLVKAGLVVFLALYILLPEFQETLLSALFSSEKQFTHSRLDLLQMTASHMLLTLSASIISSVVGIFIGFAVTHGKGRYYHEIVRTLNGFVQTLPPTAVVILAFPFLGFGWPPALLALALYSVFPVVANTVVGFQSVPSDVLDAASGMGMSNLQRLRLVEFPLALPVINTGLRHSFILNIGTATIAAVIGGGGLGTIIISGLTLQNSALVFSGTIVITGLALIFDELFNLLETLWGSWEVTGENKNE
jgi:osmoprotectant transport system permease protein